MALPGVCSDVKNRTDKLKRPRSRAWEVGFVDDAPRLALIFAGQTPLALEFETRSSKHELEGRPSLLHNRLA